MIRRILLLAILATLLPAAYEWITFPDVASLATTPPSTTAFMEQRKAELRAAGKSEAIAYQWVPYGRISPYLPSSKPTAPETTATSGSSQQPSK